MPTVLAQVNSYTLTLVGICLGDRREVVMKELERQRRNPKMPPEVREAWGMA